MPYKLQHPQPLDWICNQGHTIPMYHSDCAVHPMRALMITDTKSRIPDKVYDAIEPIPLVGWIIIAFIALIVLGFSSGLIALKESKAPQLWATMLAASSIVSATVMRYALWNRQMPYYLHAIHVFVAWYVYVLVVVFFPTQFAMYRLLMLLNVLLNEVIISTAIGIWPTQDRDRKYIAVRLVGIGLLLIWMFFVGDGLTHEVGILFVYSACSLVYTEAMQIAHGTHFGLLLNYANAMGMHRQQTAATQELTLTIQQLQQQLLLQHPQQQPLQYPITSTVA
jgi:uncharacterized membrane protein (UPF0136 family)